MGLEITYWFNHLDGKVLQVLLSPFHYLGSEIGFMVLLPAIYWAFDKEFGRRTTIMLLGAQYFSIGLKYGFHRPRPFHVAPERFNPISEYAEPGLPSGHTISGTVIGASFTRRSHRKTAKTLWILFIVLMGISRLIHGVHFPQDVIAGWIVGLLCFFGYTPLERLISRVSHRWSPNTRKLLAIGTIAIAVLILIVSAPTGVRCGKELPVDQRASLGCDFGNHYRKPSNLQFTTDDLSPGTRVLRVVIGLISLFAVYLLLNFSYYAVVGDSRALWTQLLYFLRYGLVGCWATLGAPWLFLTIEKRQR